MENSLCIELFGDRKSLLMPGPPIKKLPRTDSLPASVDVVVIGGGIIGLFTALELKEKGLDVVLFEKDEIGAEQSSRNWGWVRIGRRDPREIPLVVEAQRLWTLLSDRLEGDIAYERTGIVFTAQDEPGKERQKEWLKHAAPFNIDARMLNELELAERFPNSTLNAVGGFYCEEDGRAEPQLVLPLLAAAVRRSGVHVMPHCAARAIKTSGGKISSVITEQGEVLCHSAVVAAGAWSSLFCRNLGVDLPQLSVLSSVLRTKPSEETIRHALWTPDFSVRKRADGGFTVASGTRSVVDLVPDSFRYAKKFWPNLKAEWDSLDFRIGERSFQELKHGLEVEQIWAGLIDVTPDVIPIMSEVSEVPGLYLATGFSGHGFGIAPGAGRLMADLVTNSTPLVDAHDFRFSRFSDGSQITL